MCINMFVLMYVIESSEREIVVECVWTCMCMMVV